MSDWGTLLLLGAAAAAIIALGWWLLIETEGVYLGRRVVIWLYDLYARRYDDIKQFHSEYDHMFLAQPIMESIAPVRAPLVLDVATGTARLPLALLHHAHFQGRVIGVDLSRRMLAIAAEKLQAAVGDQAATRTPLLWSPAERLPFPDDTFDVVTCLEALEFMQRPEAVVGEIARVLRPGGLLLITNRISTRLMPGKTWSAKRVQAIVEAAGFEHVFVDYWQVDYDRVWGRKRGTSLPTLARPLAEVLRCPRCQAALLESHADRWRCPACGQRAAVIEGGIIDLSAP